jgi:hypothetical protein
MASALRAYEAAGRNVLVPRLWDRHSDFYAKGVGPVLGELLTARIRPAEAVSTIQRRADAQAGSARKRT